MRNQSSISSESCARAQHNHLVLIRRGDERDAEFFLEIEEQTTWENLPPDARQMPREALREKLLETHGLLLSCPGNVFFIAEIMDEKKDGNSQPLRAGLLWFGPCHNAITGDHDGWIYNVTVLPEFRGCGLAKKLMAHAEVHARQEGYSVIGLSVATHNEIARELYIKSGYEPSNILMRKSLAT